MEGLLGRKAYWMVIVFPLRDPCLSHCKWEAENSSACWYWPMIKEQGQGRDRDFLRSKNMKRDSSRPTSFWIFPFLQLFSIYTWGIDGRELLVKGGAWNDSLSGPNQGSAQTLLQLEWSCTHTSMRDSG